MDEGLPRKLAAIVYADVAGYSRLTGEDEEGTHLRLREALDLFSDSIVAHDGRVVHYAGDAVLADFPTVTDALRCATSVQAEILTSNTHLPQDRRVQFRVGVNLGEVIVDRDDIYGDGVNVAARLESLAEPGGICISDSVRTALGNKLSMQFRDLGEQEVKNIARPVRAWQWVHESDSLMTTSVDIKSTAIESSLPSIAILPFENLSGEAEIDRLSDGITDELITAFSRQTGMKVLSRHSTLPFKDTAVDLPELRRKLGAHYILEGSVRKAGDRVRIAARLVDAGTGNDLWGDQYDGEMGDVFTLQDDLRLGIVSATRSQIHLKDAQRVRNVIESELTDGELLALASKHMQTLGLDSSREAARFAGLVTERSPNNPMALAMSASCVLQENEYSEEEVPQADAERAFSLIDRAIRLNEESDYAHYVRGRLLLRLRHDHDLAIAEAERSLELNPNYTYGYALLGYATSCRGDPDLGIELVEKALRADPRRAGNVNFFYYIAVGHFVAQRYRVAIQWVEKAAQRVGYTAQLYLVLVSSHALLGETRDARRYLDATLEAYPSATIHGVKVPPFGNADDKSRFLSGLRKAGLPG